MNIFFSDINMAVDTIRDYLLMTADLTLEQHAFLNERIDKCKPNTFLHLLPNI